MDRPLFKKTFFILAHWMQGQAMSGGDRIFIELSKRWSSQWKIKFFVSSEGWKICQREGLGDFDHEILVSDQWNRFGYLLNYLYRTLTAIFKLLKWKVEEGDIVYSSSDFWPDALPALILKLRFKEKVRWIAGFYLVMTPPWRKDFPYKGRSRLMGLFYWLTQWPIFLWVKKYSDWVFVTSEPDVPKFVTPKRGLENIVVVKGGIDQRPSMEYLCSASVRPISKRKYDACFIGRFYYPKGVLELMDIWQEVCKARPNARLAVIGVGILEGRLKEKIERLGLKEKIDLLGFKDGDEKYEIFKESKLVLHPAIYDSGGMAACEAMAWGLPGVSFDLEALKTYYPKGMLKTPCYDLKKFSDHILLLLNDTTLYEKMKEEAIVLAREWDWDKRAEEILKKIRNLIP
ncbi:MAG: glycosyltransferase family 4 protein [Chlamydiae bacterium]|nr:glycosyltransferase family 4 protein [Chlamydiota bacterium]MBI3277335.1 glycosyltransferase family 4 protein [Chlamydiota bacterium]